MEPRHGQQQSVGREGQGGNHRQPGVFGRVLRIIPPSQVLGRVVLRPLLNPLRDDRNLRFGQRRLVLGHLGLAAMGSDQLDKTALGRLARHDGRLTRLASFEHPVEARHHVGPTRLRRLMTTLAVGLQDRADLLVIADLRRRGRRRSGFCPVLSNVFGGGHQQMSRSLADSREYDPDREPPEG